MSGLMRFAAPAGRREFSRHAMPSPAETREKRPHGSAYTIYRTRARAQNGNLAAGPIGRSSIHGRGPMVAAIADEDQLFASAVAECLRDCWDTRRDDTHARIGQLAA